MNRVVKKQQGFTLVELMLAMSFISLLLLAIAMTIVQIGGMYNKGMTLKEVNLASRDISDDIRRSMAATLTVTLPTDYVLTPNASTPSGGRLCLGKYSYIWNYAKAIEAGSPGVTKYQNTPNGPTGDVRFVKIPDSSKIYCAKNGVGALTYADIRALDVPQAQELLVAGDHALGVYQFDFITPIPVSSADPATNQQLFTLRFTLGAGKTSALNATQTACLPEDDINADPLYCSVQQFTLVVRSGSGV